MSIIKKSCIKRLMNVSLKGRSKEKRVCHPSKNRHKKAPKNEMNRSISLIYANRPHLFHGLLDNEPLPV